MAPSRRQRAGTTGQARVEQTAVARVAPGANTTTAPAPSRRQRADTATVQARVATIQPHVEQTAIATVNLLAWPLANRALSQDLYDFIQEAKNERLLKKGANEVIKAINRGQAGLVLIAADTSPFAIVLNLPLLCEDKNVPYVYVPSKVAIGRAAGMSRPVIAVCVTTNDGGELSGRLASLQNKVERLLI